MVKYNPFDLLEVFEDEGKIVSGGICVYEKQDTHHNIVRLSINSLDNICEVIFYSIKNGRKNILVQAKIFDIEKIICEGSSFAFNDVLKVIDYNGEVIVKINFSLYISIYIKS